MDILKVTETFQTQEDWDHVKRTRDFFSSYGSMWVWVFPIVSLIDSETYLCRIYIKTRQKQPVLTGSKIHRKGNNEKQ